MDGFTVWLATALFFSWLSLNQAQPPAPAHKAFKETVILLPDAQGKKTGIVVKAGGQEIVVTEPLQGVELSGGKAVGKSYTADEMQQQYPEVMQALPEKPHTFILRFEENETKLTAESAAIVSDIQKEIAKRAAPEITVIGHTDRAGTEEANFRLSLQRAEAVRDLLVAGGMSAEIIQVVGRGELEPEVKTDDGIAEPLNRRVEISVR
jgi:OmpA-OmpF porin, OOP family